MQPFRIPVRAAPIIGPGSQPPDEVDFAVLAMPQGMNTFEMPRVPERADPAVLAAVRELLAGLLRQLDAWDPADADAPPVLDLAGVPPAVLTVACNRSTTHRAARSQKRLKEVSTGFLLR